MSKGYWSREKVYSEKYFVVKNQSIQETCSYEYRDMAGMYTP